MPRQVSRHTAASWKELNRRILEQLDLKAEFAALGIQFASAAPAPNSSGWIECHAIGREDTSPSAGVNTLTGRYKDHGGSGDNLSLWELAAKLHPFPTWQEARQFYAEKTGIALPDANKSDSKKGPRDPAEHLRFLPWNESLAALWCRHKPPVTPAAIQTAGGRIARYRNAYTVVAVPIWGPDLQNADPCGWVLWNTTGGPLPIFRGKNQPPEWEKMKTAGGSSAGLIIVGQVPADGLDSLPADLAIWKTEGPTDALALWGCLPPASRPTNLILTNAGGANQHPPDWTISVFAGRRVVLIHDADAPGESGGTRWADWLAPIASSLHWPRLPYSVEPSHGKDLRDYLIDAAALAPYSGDGWQGVLALVADAPDLHVDQPTASDASPGETDQEASPSASPVVQESDDDPHRLARVYLDAHGRELHPPHRLTLRYWREEWWAWRGTRYHILSDSNLRALVAASVKAEFDRQNLAAQSLAAGRDGKLPSTQKVTRTLVGNVIQALESICAVNWIDQQPAWIGPLDNSTGPPNRRSSPNYLSLVNGILDVDKLAEWVKRDVAGTLQPDETDPPITDFLQPHTPEWFSSVAVPYEFDGNANCPRWKQTLDQNLESDLSRIAILQEWAGYCLLPGTSQQRFLVLEGEGANGKSVYLAGLTAILGLDNVSNIPLELFGTRFTLTDTIGRLANFAGDCGEIDKVAEGHLKSFTSGDRMFFDRKNKPGVNCIPTARLTLACNNRPRFTDRSGGIWRRMLLVPFLREVPASEMVRGMDQSDYWYRTGEVPGMLCWALAGLARLRQQGGFTESKICQDALDDYKQEINPARSFLTDCCEENPQATTSTKELYEGYKKWCQQNGYRPLSERSFGKEVRRVHRSVKRKQGGGRLDRFWYYEGVHYIGYE